MSRALPLPTRRGLSRAEAAGYVGIGVSKFDALVVDGRMPKALRIDGRRLWDVRQLDSAFDALHDDREDAANPWDSLHASP